MRANAIFTIAIVVLAGGLASTCGSDSDTGNSTPEPNGVVIESISPQSGDVGTEIVITGSGFAAENNDIGFSHPGIDFQGRRKAYLNGVASADGTTLRFTLREVMGACAFSELGPNEACPDIGIVLPGGESEVFVVNANGTSNSVPFTRTGATAQPTP